MNVQSIARATASAAAVAGLAAGMSVGVVGSAGAATTACDNTVVGGQNNSSGYVIVNSGSAYRHGPANTYCAYDNRGGKAFVWCTRVNSDNNKWYYVRDDGTEVLGWVYSGNISAKSTTGTFSAC